MMLRGSQIFESNALKGERVFLSLHALRHSGQQNFRGRLVKTEGTHVYLENQPPINIDLTIHDAIMSKSDY